MKVKYGIIGCGGIANGKHLPSMATLENVEITAYCDLIRERAEKANAEYSNGKAQVFTDYRELLKTGVDAVAVCTPNCSHCEITVAALDAGKHVICEKPMATSYTEALAMIEARDRNKKVLTIGYQNRYRPDSLYLKRECEQGTFGDIYFAHAHAIRRRAVPTWGVFLDGEKQGGGPLIDIGTHALDLTLFMMDNYEPAYCVGTAYHKLNNDRDTANAWGDWDPAKFTVEDAAFGFVVMKNGATVTLSSSWALNSLDVNEAITSFSGTKAGADMPGDGRLRINGVRCGRQYVLEPDFNAGGVAFFDGASEKPADLEAKRFYECVTGKAEPYVTAEQAAAVTRILEGIYKSADGKKEYRF